MLEYYRFYNLQSLKSNLVDCEWTEWNCPECSKTCGTGFENCTRNRIKEAQHGGRNCSGNATYDRSCESGECPGICKVVNPSIFLAFLFNLFLILRKICNLNTH